MGGTALVADPSKGTVSRVGTEAVEAFGVIGHTDINPEGKVNVVSDTPIR